MDTQSTKTEAIVRNHLQAFVEQKGIEAILHDYDDHARFISETKTYEGKQEIGSFFTNFIASLSAAATKRFSLRALRIDGEIAYITWSVTGEVALGTDTFVVRNGKIVSQTFAMYSGSQ